VITPKIKALFQFIEYLHSNIENFNRNNDLIKELELLDEERQQVCCKRNFTEKLRYDELQSEIEKKFKVLQDNTATLIKGKAKELNICNFDNEPDYSFNGIEYEIRQLKENFSKKDLPEIAKSKQQYIEYRQNTHKTFLSLGFFIDGLDLITKSLFYYFKDTEQNEYEAFETKTFEAGSIKEAIQKYFNEAHKDQRFQLTSFVEETEQAKPTYKSFKREIEKNGWVILKTETDAVNIYTPELAVIFTSKELPALNMDTKQEATINGCKYLKTYIEAYKEGEQYFTSEFKISPNTLYGAMAEQYVRDIHLNFFHIKHTGANEGWGYVKRNYPIFLNHKAVKEFGYYSGIVNKVEEQVKKYPILFATFDKCEHDLTSKLTETKTDKLKAELGKYGFFELSKVKQLSEPNKQKLIELISSKGLPYSIAMFEFLDFLKHIEREYFKTKGILNKEVAKWFNSDKDGRSVKGNISSLSDYSTENKSKYTAHTHKETVKTDYQKLK